MSIKSLREYRELISFIHLNFSHRHRNKCKCSLVSHNIQSTVTAALACWPSDSHSAWWLSMADWIKVASVSVDTGNLQWYFGVVSVCWALQVGTLAVTASMAWSAACMHVCVFTPRPHGPGAITWVAELISSSPSNANTYIKNIDVKQIVPLSKVKTKKNQ